MEKLSQRGLAVESLLEGKQVIYLEDLQAGISRFERVSTFLAVRLLPAWLLQALFCYGRNADATAAILFSSGSEGQPKGDAEPPQPDGNIKQTSDVLNTQHDDVVMASLPLFHAFGFTVTQLLPLIEGLPMAGHADPTDAPGVASTVASIKPPLCSAPPACCACSTAAQRYSPPCWQAYVLWWPVPRNWMTAYVKGLKIR